MLLLSLVTWWYGAGWLQFTQRAVARITGTLKFFSVGVLFKTLFSPYRQISVGRVQGPIGVQLRAWADLQISRVIGAAIRLVVILFGLAATVLIAVAALLLILLWPVVPILPLVAGLLAFGGTA